MVLCCGVDASHSTRNDIWSMLKISLWFPIPFKVEGKTRGVYLSYHHSINSTFTFLAQDPNTLHILPPPLLIHSSGLSYASSLLQDSPISFNSWDQGVLAIFLFLFFLLFIAALYNFSTNTLKSPFREIQVTTWAISFPSPLLSLTDLWDLFFSVTLAPGLAFYFLTSPYLMHKEFNFTPITLLGYRSSPFLGFLNSDHPHSSSHHGC